MAYILLRTTHKGGLLMGFGAAVSSTVHFKPINMASFQKRAKQQLFSFEKMENDLSNKSQTIEGIRLSQLYQEKMRDLRSKLNPRATEYRFNSFNEFRCALCLTGISDIGLTTLSAPHGPAVWLVAGFANPVALIFYYSSVKSYLTYRETKRSNRKIDEEIKRLETQTDPLKLEVQLNAHLKI